MSRGLLTGFCRTKTHSYAINDSSSRLSSSSYFTDFASRTGITNASLSPRNSPSPPHISSRATEFSAYHGGHIGYGC